MKLLKQVDHLICCYLGLDAEVAQINRLRRVNNELKVAQTSGFKRHNMISSWREFAHLEAANLEHYGSMIGSSFAKQLVISFKEPSIRVDDHV